MFKNFFEARDAWDAELVAEETRRGGERSIQTPYALFRVLLEHTIFDPKSPAYGWVTDKHTGQETLGKLMGITRRQTIARALSDLEGMYLIERHRARNRKPGSSPDRIKITWEPMQVEDAPSEGAQSAHQTESALSETESALSIEGAQSALSSTSKKGLEELTTKNAEGRSPSGDIPPAPSNPKTTPPTPLMGAEEARIHIEEELPAIAAQLYSDRPLDEAVSLVREQIMFPAGDHRRRLPFLRQLEELRSLCGEGR